MTLSMDGLGYEGFFFEPTVLRTYDSSWQAANEEPFGPLAIVRSFTELQDALAEANRLPVGLAAYVFTRDIRAASQLVADLECGSVCVNHCISSLPETPFGGFLDSGLGKEGGPEGVAAFTRTKYVSQS